MASLLDLDLISSTHEETTISIGDEEARRRDELREVMKMSSKETLRVQTWRIAVTLSLLVTSVLVTVSTHYFLDREEDKNFRTGFEQFARTLADSAIGHQRNLRDGMSALATQITVAANSNNATWPFFYMHSFQTYGADFLLRSTAEMIGVDNIVKHKDRNSYVEFMDAHYAQLYAEAHMLAYGNLDLLDTDPTKYNSFISRRVDGEVVPDIERDLYYVRTTQSPPSRQYGIILNYNLGTVPAITTVPTRDIALVFRNETHFTEVRPFTVIPPNEHARYHVDSAADNPHSFAIHPVHREVQDYNSEIVATLTAAMAWDAALLNLLPDNVKGIYCVIQNTCNQTYSYEVDGKKAIYRGEGDSHDTKYNDMGMKVNLSLHTHPNFTTTPGHCIYSMSIYPTDRFKATYDTRTPEFFAAFVGGTFLAIAVVFFIYDLMVRRRNAKMVYDAAKSNAVVSSLFPGSLRDRVLDDGYGMSAKSKAGTTSLRNFLSMDGKGSKGAATESKPLADLFLDCSVMFADIAGFTAWSSVREPTQVFTLLERVYSSFDEIAKKREVFKVETVGDCYVAATGIPEPRSDHAVAIVRFALECVHEMHRVCKKLEVVLGPDTAELSIRVGIHSGPVTAGVLRGERARFQLFGDTMNTCSRIERTGARDRIHISQETANQLMNAGKADWLEQRQDMVTAKGLGELQTFWIKSTGRFAKGEANQEIPSTTMTELGNSADWGDSVLRGGDEHFGNALSEKMNRLIDWNVEILLGFVRQIVARRCAVSKDEVSRPTIDLVYETQDGMPLEEVKEIITLPEFDATVANKQQDPNYVIIPDAARTQLKDLVTCIASLYRQNDFHSFDHASHVLMSVVKLMSRIVAPTILEEKTSQETSGGSLKHKKDMAASLHDHTYGITSDPLTQFACAWSALVHDVDHTGVPNTQLIKENADLTLLYKYRSVAEQNSFDLSWGLLMDDRFRELRGVLFGSSADLSRFRQLVINGVMATDLGDKELKALRNARWDKAFKTSSGQAVEEAIQDAQSRDAVNRKATIVIEHLIQASDVAHTMQHWHVYRKWNERLFMEMYTAFKAGRSDKNPADFWYEGEIGFFDFYIIPLAKKLKDCGVFGVSSHEYLDYALKNRHEWEMRGREVVAEMLEKLG